MFWPPSSRTFFETNICKVTNLCCNTPEGPSRVSCWTALKKLIVQPTIVLFGPIWQRYFEGATWHTGHVPHSRLTQPWLSDRVLKLAHAKE